SASWRPGVNGAYRRAEASQRARREAGGCFDKALVAGHLVEPVEDQLQLARSVAAVGLEGAAEAGDGLQLFGGVEQLLVARAAARDIDRREEAEFCEGAVQAHFPVAGSLELLVDQVVEAALGVHQDGGQDREAAGFLRGPRGAEELAREAHR